MKRIIVMVLCNIFTLPYLLFMLMKQSKNPNKYTKEKHLELFQKIVKCANKGGKVKLEAHGLENIPNEDGFMFFPNHQGLYDVLAIVGTSNKYFGTVAKKEVGNIFFLKQIFACSGSYLIDREDIRQSMKVISNVSRDVKAGKNFLIFAEGTRSRNGNNTLEFKGGSFKSATKAKAPIVPIALIDSFKAFDTSSTEDVTVRIFYLEPLLYDEYREMSTIEIAEEVRNRIQETIENNQ